MLTMWLFRLFYAISGSTAVPIYSFSFFCELLCMWLAMWLIWRQSVLKRKIVIQIVSILLLPGDCSIKRWNNLKTININALTVIIYWPSRKKIFFKNSVWPNNVSKDSENVAIKVFFDSYLLIFGKLLNCFFFRLRMDDSNSRLFFSNLTLLPFFRDNPIILDTKITVKQLLNAVRSIYCGYIIQSYKNLLSFL